MQTIRLLTIGNSFAENALTYLEEIARGAGGPAFEVGRANLGGCTLEKHWNLALYTARRPEYKTYCLGKQPDCTPREASLQEALEAARWDVVTLQQASPLSWRPETFQPQLGHLADLVRRLAPHARIHLHQTWAYRTDSPFLPQNGLTQEIMFERIRGAYAQHAAVLGCGLLPTGEAVQLARRVAGRTFVWPDPDFDYQRAEAPALPCQEHSLAVGWHWAISNTPNGVPELRLDANHLNAYGCYLAGCVWFECLAGTDVRPCAFRPPEIDSQTAAFLRATAHEAVRYTVARADGKARRKRNTAARK
jgi:hypothetical protein